MQINGIIEMIHLLFLLLEVLHFSQMLSFYLFF